MPGRRSLPWSPVELDRAPHPAEDMEVVGEDRACRARRAGERLRVGIRAVALVLDLEFDATAVTVQHEVQPLAVLDNPLRSGAEPRLVQSDQGQRLAVAAKTGAPVAVDAAPQVGPSPGRARCRCGGCRPTRSWRRTRPGTRSPASRDRHPAGCSPSSLTSAVTALRIGRPDAPSLVGDLLGPFRRWDVGVADVAHVGDASHRRRRNWPTPAGTAPDGHRPTLLGRSGPMPAHPGRPGGTRIRSPPGRCEACGRRPG